MGRTPDCPHYPNCSGTKTNGKWAFPCPDQTVWCQKEEDVNLSRRDYQSLVDSPAWVRWGLAQQLETFNDESR